MRGHDGLTLGHSLWSLLNLLQRANQSQTTLVCSLVSKGGPARVANQGPAAAAAAASNATAAQFRSGELR